MANAIIDQPDPQPSPTPLPTDQINAYAAKIDNDNSDKTAVVTVAGIVRVMQEIASALNQ